MNRTRQKSVRNTILVKGFRGVIIVVVPIGEPITSEVASTGSATCDEEKEREESVSEENERLLGTRSWVK